MSQVARRALSLLRRPAAALSTLGIAGVGLGALSHPLFRIPGLELGLLVTIAVSLLGGAVGIAAGRIEGRLLAGVDPRPPGALRQDAAFGSVRLAWSAACYLLVPAVLLPLLIALPLAAATTRCDPFALALFYPVLTLPSALLAAAVGVLWGLAARRGWQAGVGHLLTLLLSLVPTLWPVLAGPQVFAYNHFFGHLPGPLYDEVVSLQPPLLWYRLQTLLLTAALLGLVATLLDARRGRLGRPRIRPLALLLALSAGGGVVLLELEATRLGFRSTHETVAAALGGRRTTPHFSLHYPLGVSSRWVERMERDLELRWTQLAAFQGAIPEGRLRVYVYRTPEEKHALVGAGNTQFAKPWLGELHLNLAAFPHPTLKHELAHVMAASLADGPFNVTARLLGLWPLMGLIEGWAVAADDPPSELTLHEWAAGMRREGLGPDLRGLLSPFGFYGTAPARAYVSVGSFLRFLVERHGPEKVAALYASGDFEAALGRPLAQLVTEWEAWLDTLELDPSRLNLAFARFRHRSLFARPCAREVARLSELAYSALQGDPATARELFARCAHLQPGEPAFELGQARALARMGYPAEALTRLERLQSLLADEPTLAAQVAVEAADVSLALGEPLLAAHLLEGVLSARPGPAMSRTAAVKLAALESPVLRGPLAAYFGDTPDALRLLVLTDGLERAPPGSSSAAILDYLVGRRLHLWRLAPARALQHLQRSRRGPLPGVVATEADRLAVEAAYLAGRCDTVRALVVESLARAPDDPALAHALSEWVDRCDFEEQAYGGPLVVEGVLAPR